MQIVKQIRDGSFDKKSNSDTDSISPNDWRTHFSELLGPKIGKTDQHLVLEDFIQSNVDSNNKYLRSH